MSSISEHVRTRSEYRDFLAAITASPLDDGVRLSSAGIEALLASPYLNRIAALNLNSNTADNEGVTLLANSAWLPRLRTLSINSNRISTDGVRWLASADVSRLLQLELGGNPLEDAGAIALCSNRWPALRELSVYASSIGPAGARALASEGMFPNLIRLSLWGNVLGPEGGTVRGWSLCGKSISRTTASALPTRWHWPRRVPWNCWNHRRPAE